MALSSFKITGQTAAGSFTAGSSQLLAGAATLAGAGALLEADTQILRGVATLPGAGALAVVAFEIAQGAATLGGTGTLVADGTPEQFDGAVLAGLGTLVADSSIQGSSSSATLAGQGSLLEADVQLLAGSATLPGAGALAADGTPEQFDGATLTGTGALSTKAFQRAAAGAVLAGAGTFNGAAAELLAAGAVLSGSAQLAADSSVKPGSSRAVLGGEGGVFVDAVSTGAGLGAVDDGGGFTVRHRRRLAARARVTVAVAGQIQARLALDDRGLAKIGASLGVVLGGSATGALSRAPFRRELRALVKTEVAPLVIARAAVVDRDLEDFMLMLEAA